MTHGAAAETARIARRSSARASTRHQSTSLCGTRLISVARAASVASGVGRLAQGGQSDINAKKAGSGWALMKII
jgi:hypothetical protein